MPVYPVIFKPLASWPHQKVFSPCKWQVILDSWHSLSLISKHSSKSVCQEAGSKAPHQLDSVSSARQSKQWDLWTCWLNSCGWIYVEFIFSLPSLWSHAWDCAAAGDTPLALCASGRCSRHFVEGRLPVSLVTAQQISLPMALKWTTGCLSSQAVLIHTEKPQSD